MIYSILFAPQKALDLHTKSSHGENNKKLGDACQGNPDRKTDAAEHLKTKDDIEAYLEAALEENDPK